MKIDPAELYRSIEALEKMNEELGNTYDAADRASDDQYDDWRQSELEREQQSEEALEACLKAGVETKYLVWLAREVGCTRWALQKSLEGI